MFVLGLINTDAFDFSQVSLKARYKQTVVCLSMLIFGQIIDNTRQIKILFVSIEVGITIAVFWLGTEFVVLLKESGSYAEANSVNSLLVLTSSYTLIVVIQLFNWFSKRHLASLVGFCQVAHSIGYWSKFAIMGQVSTYP